MSLPFRILGPLEVGADEPRLPLQARVLLGVLLLRAGEVVSAQRLADEIWGERPPASWVNALQVYASRIRKTLADAGVDAELRRHGPGYALEVPPETVDALVFERMSRSAFALVESDPAGAEALIRDALSLWRGPVLDGLGFESLASVEIERLNEARLGALEQRLELDLVLGRQREIIGELEQLVSEHPFREGLRCKLVLTLYRAGRQADALAECRRARRFLVDELGLEPGEELRELERAVLRHDPAIAAPTRTKPPGRRPAAGAQARRPVTAVAVVIDAAGVADRDAELLETLVTGWEEDVRAALETHGATVVEAGAGVMTGVFGVAVAHEDDPLRACRAALALAHAFEVEEGQLGDLGFAIAVESGEILVGEGSLPRGGLIAAVQQLAGQAGEIVLGPQAWRLVADGVRVRDEDGRRCLVGVERGADAIPRNLARPLVGRAAELELLLRVFDRSLEARQASLLVVSGPAGIGKSRIAAELAASVEDRATVLRARCLPEEAGVALAPLADLARDLRVGRGRRGLLSLVATEDDPDEIVARFLAVADAEERVASSREETDRAVRKMFEGLAAERPLLLVVEDLHWAEPVFLDLLEQVAGADSPLSIVCTTRPELLAERTSWAAERARWSTLAVGPLRDTECAELLSSLRSERLEVRTRARIVEASGGNPLFLEQLAAMEEEWADETVEPPLPASLRGLLVARLDRLDDGQRAVLENAAILPDPFSLTDLAALSPASSVGSRIESLVEREFLRRADAAATLSFGHPLMRTTAYEMLPKRRRAELHERYAKLVGTAAHSGGATDELVGHHLERAFRYRVEIAPTDPSLPELADRARHLLTIAGRRRYEQGDVTTAISLLTRARASAIAETDVPAGLLLDLGDALREAGRLDEAEVELRNAIAAAAAMGDEVSEWRARSSLVRLLLQLPGHPIDEVRAPAARTLAELTRLGDAEGLASAWWVQGWLTWLECRAEDTERALATSIDWARRAGDTRLEAHGVNLYLGAALFGPMPVEQAVERCLEFRRRHHDRQRIVASSVRALAVLRAMQGQFDDARELVVLDRAILSELGLRYLTAAATEAYGLVELLAGDPETAERTVRVGYEQLTRMADTNALPTIAALLGEALVALERYDEALAVTAKARQHADAGDLGAQVQWRCANAKALAWLGRDKNALRVARDAVRIASITDFLNLHADALVALAEVNRLQARSADSVNALTQAAKLYTQKGNLVAGARADVALRAARRSRRRTAATRPG